MRGERWSEEDWRIAVRGRDRKIDELTQELSEAQAELRSVREREENWKAKWNGQWERAEELAARIEAVREWAEERTRVLTPSGPDSKYVQGHLDSLASLRVILAGGDPTHLADLNALPALSSPTESRETGHGLSEGTTRTESDAARSQKEDAPGGSLAESVPDQCPSCGSADPAVRRPQGLGGSAEAGQEAKTPCCPVCKGYGWGEEPEDHHLSDCQGTCPECWCPGCHNGWVECPEPLDGDRCGSWEAYQAVQADSTPRERKADDPFD